LALGGDLDEPIAQAFHLLLVHQDAVDPVAVALAGGADFAATDQNLGFGGDRFGGTPVLQRGSHLEAGFDRRFVGPGADGAARGFAAEDSIDRVEDDRFPGSGFPGEHVQPGPEVEFEVVDEGEVVDAEGQQHGRWRDRDLIHKYQFCCILTQC
jgi:hypothetical protein